MPPHKARSTTTKATPKPKASTAVKTYDNGASQHVLELHGVRECFKLELVLTNQCLWWHRRSHKKDTAMQPEPQIKTPKLQPSPLQLPKSLHQIRESEGLTISLSSLLIILLTLMIPLLCLVLVCRKLINMWPLHHLHNGTSLGFILLPMLLSELRHLQPH